jgi:hypothetical protein
VRIYQVYIEDIPGTSTRIFGVFIEYIYSMSGLFFREDIYLAYTHFILDIYPIYTMSHCIFAREKTRCHRVYFEYISSIYRVYDEYLYQAKNKADIKDIYSIHT